MSNSIDTSTLLRVAAITTETLLPITTEALRERVGARDKNITLTGFSEQIGIDDRSARDYVGGETIPPTMKLMRMFAFFEPCFANKILAVAGLEGARRILPRGVGDFELNKFLTEVIAKLGGMLIDARIDHRERRILLPLVRRLIDILQGWVAHAEAIEARTGKDGGHD